MGLIQQFQKAGAQRRKEVAALGREVAAMRYDADAFVSHLHQVSADRRSQVATMLSDADAFVGDLHQVSAERRSHVATMVAEADAFVGHLHRVSVDRRKEVAALIADAAAFVGQLHRLSAARRKEVWGGAGPVATAAAPPPPAAPTVAEGATATLRDVIFAYLAEHPDGAKLAQMEQDLGMPRIKMTGHIGSLIQEKKVEKREMLYFAV